MAVCSEHLFCLFTSTSAFLFVCQFGTETECSDVSVKAKQAARWQTTAVGAPGRGTLEGVSLQPKEGREQGTMSFANVPLFYCCKVSIIVLLKKQITDISVYKIVSLLFKQLHFVYNCFSLARDTPRNSALI